MRMRCTYSKIVNSSRSTSRRLFSGVTAAVLLSTPVGSWVDQARGGDTSNSVPLVILVEPAKGTDPLPAALDRVRALRAAHPEVPLEIRLAPGFYQLSKSLEFRPEHGGRRGAPVTWRGPDEGEAVISGGYPIRDWQVDAHGVWQANLPDLPGPDGFAWEPHSLFVDGKRAQRARIPNEGYFRITGLIPAGYLPAEDEQQRLRLGFQYDPDQIPRDADVDGGIVMLLHAWKSSVHEVAETDRERHILRFTGPFRSSWTIGRWDAEQRYWIEGVPAAFDAPGEWWFDREARIVRYRPLPGQRPDKVDAVAARLKRLMMLQGDPEAGRFVEHLRFQRITLAHADWRFEREQGGNDVYQAHPGEGAAIEWDGARHCWFVENRLQHLGRFALWLRHGNRHCRIERNLIKDVGAGGVRLGVTVMPQDPVMVTSHNLVENNLISSYGRVFYGGHGVLITHSADNQIRRNEIRDGHYSGMQVGFNWGYQDTFTLRNQIVGNYIHHVGQNVLSDLGGIYTLGKQGGALIHNNLIHDVFAYDRSAIGWGIYLDQASMGITVSSNLTFNTSSGGIMNTGLPGNHIHDNIFTRSRNALVWRFQRGELTPPTTFQRNVLVVTQGLLLNRDDGRTDRTSRWDHNLYWRSDGRPVMFYGGSLKRWQRNGHGHHSVIADPLFVDAQEFDFRLASNSPALIELGVKPIDLASVGLYGDVDWLALAEEHRQRPARELPPPQRGWYEDGYLNLGFEEIEVGDRPRVGRIEAATDGSKGSVAVSAARAVDGDKSLQLIDSPQVEHSWDPKIELLPGIDGSIEVSAWVWLSPAAELTIEWRKNNSQFLEGPKLRLNSQGAYSQGERLSDVPVESWFHVMIRADVGPDRDETWSLTMQGGDKTFFDNKDLKAKDHIPLLDYVGFMSTGQQQAEIFLDNISIREMDPSAGDDE